VSKDAAATAATISLDGGADNDTYVVNGINTNRTINIVDSAGTNDTIIFNQEDDDPTFDAYVDGTTNTLNFYGQSYPAGVLEFSANPFLTVTAGTIETIQLFRYGDLNDPTSLKQSVTGNLVAATRDTATQSWIGKGTDKADIFLATTNGANNYDGGKGDDIIHVNANTGSVAQGGEGFNTLSVIEGLAVDGLNGQIFGEDVFSIGTLSYAWAANTVEVNMEAGIGVAYDAKGEEIVGVDEFYGFANVIGGKGNDLIVGDVYANRLDGGDGKDTLAGGGGFDTLIGGLGDDTYLVDLGNRKIIVSERIAPTTMGEVNGVLTLQGGADAKSIDTVVLSGINRFQDIRFNVTDTTVSISQSGSSSTILVDKGVEQIAFDKVGNGAPVVYATNWSNIGTKSADFVVTKDAGGMALGGQGDDFLMGGQGQDILLGGLGNDIIRGGAGSDKLIGNAGNDILHVHGGDGDLALGGAGADTFIIKGASSTNLGKSLVLDFKLNEDFINFNNAAGVTINAGSAVLSKGVLTDPTQTIVVNLDARGNMTFENNSSNAVTQVVSLIGIDTQQELSALMDRIVFG
jgi:Ca2+-binding RTX toxin-like protein